MKIYISGAITGEPNYKKTFDEAEAALKAAGHIVINPVMPEGLGSREEYLEVCFKEIDMCEAIYTLPTVENSIGAAAEMIYGIEKNRIFLRVNEDKELEMYEPEIYISDKNERMIKKIGSYILNEKHLEHLEFFEGAKVKL